MNESQSFFSKALSPILQAAIVFDEIGDLAYPYIPQLQRSLSGQPNKYITRVANRALNDLLGTAYVVK